MSLSTIFKNKKCLRATIQLDAICQPLVRNKKKLKNAASWIVTVRKKGFKTGAGFHFRSFFHKQNFTYFLGFVRERHICHIVTIITWYRIFLCKVMKVNEGLKRPVIMICMLNWSNKNHVKNHREWKEGWKPDLKMRLFLKGELGIMRSLLRNIRCSFCVCCENLHVDDDF